MKLKTVILVLLSLAVGAATVALITRPWETEVVRMTDTTEVKTLEKKCSSLADDVAAQSSRANNAEALYKKEADRHDALRKEIQQLNALRVALQGQLSTSRRQVSDLTKKVSQARSLNEKIEELEEEIERLKDSGKTGTAPSTKRTISALPASP